MEGRARVTRGTLVIPVLRYPVTNLSADIQVRGWRWGKGVGRVQVGFGCQSGRQGWELIASLLASPGGRGWTE